MKPQVRVSIPINAKPEVTEHIKHVLDETFPQINIIYELSEKYTTPTALSIEGKQSNLGCVETENVRDLDTPFRNTIEEIHTKANQAFREFLQKADFH